MLSIISFLAVLSVLVLVHEFGHFIVAKRLGVRVLKFSIGFGPKIASIKKGDTEYLISAIPLGGYVKMAGDEPWEKLANEKGEFLSRSVGDRFKIIFAGPFLNYVLAFAIFSVIFMIFDVFTGKGFRNINLSDNLLIPIGCALVYLIIRFTLNLDYYTIILLWF